MCTVSHGGASDLTVFCKGIICSKSCQIEGFSEHDTSQIHSILHLVTKREMSGLLLQLSSKPGGNEAT